MNRAVVLGAATLALAFAPFPFPRPGRPGPAQELRRMQGTWRVTLRSRSPGRVAQVEFVAEIAGDRMRLLALGALRREWVIHLDPSRAPRRVDLTLAGPQGTAQKPVLGVYQLEGDTLTIGCGPGDAGGERPASLDAARHSGSIMTLKRAGR